MIDYHAVRQTIATETNVELLRGLVVHLLGEVDQRRARLEKLDPITEAAFKREESERTRSQLGNIHDLTVMRSLAQDVYRGLEGLDVQIARAEAK